MKHNTSRLAKSIQLNSKPHVAASIFIMKVQYFLKQARTGLWLACGWFLKLILYRTLVCVCVCVCVCVRACMRACVYVCVCVP